MSKATEIDVFRERFNRILDHARQCGWDESNTIYEWMDTFSHCSCDFRAVIAMLQHEIRIWDSQAEMAKRDGENAREHKCRERAEVLKQFYKQCLPLARLWCRDLVEAHSAASDNNNTVELQPVGDGTFYIVAPQEPLTVRYSSGGPAFIKPTDRAHQPVTFTDAEARAFCASRQLHIKESSNV